MLNNNNNDDNNTRSNNNKENNDKSLLRSLGRSRGLGPKQFLYYGTVLEPADLQ